jgi:3-oxoacyl-[acyl-carrier protein] reductase
VLDAYHEGGWSAEALERELPALLEGRLQSVGESFPDLPEELKAAP